MTIGLFTTRISEANCGNALFNSASADAASSEFMKFPTRVYQFGALENVYICPLYFGKRETIALPPLPLIRESVDYAHH